ncbi:hypothetical protein JCM9534A_20850 [Catenuloplanes indicus JCM 9534]
MPRIGANSASPSAGSPTCAKRSATTNAPRNGSGSAGSGGSRCTATDVVADSGSAGAHVRHACSSAGASAPAANAAPP